MLLPYVVAPRAAGWLRVCLLSLLVVVVARGKLGTWSSRAVSRFNEWLGLACFKGHSVGGKGGVGGIYMTTSSGGRKGS